jgi:hypothetical protein
VASGVYTTSMLWTNPSATAVIPFASPSRGHSRVRWTCPHSSVAEVRCARRGADRSARDLAMRRVTVSGLHAGHDLRGPLHQAQYLWLPHHSPRTRGGASPGASRLHLLSAAAFGGGAASNWVRAFASL